MARKKALGETEFILSSFPRELTSDLKEQKAIKWWLDNKRQAHHGQFMDHGQRLVMGRNPAGTLLMMHADAAKVAEQNGVSILTIDDIKAMIPQMVVEYQEHQAAGTQRVPASEPRTNGHAKTPQRFTRRPVHLLHH